MRLKNILKGLRIKADVMDMEIKNITSDSRDCAKGSMFFAVPGAVNDGHDFARAAYEKGARAFIVQRSVVLPKDAQVIPVPSSRRALSIAASNFYKNPSLKLDVFGIVGTNGKTTTSYILESVMEKAGMAPGVIGTVNYRYAGKSSPAVNTTPESSQLQKLMRNMISGDAKSAIVEVSSHALHQGRVDGIYFDAGIFTNLTQDHLDYHLNMRNYFLSKRRFFAKSLIASGTKKSVCAAINIDDEYGMRLFKEFKDRYKIIPFSLNKCAGVFPLKIRKHVSGMELSISTPSGALKIKTRLTGEFNIYNILGAVSLCVGRNVPLNTIRDGIESLKNVPGRMQKISTDSGTVFIDYAHTPDALLRVLSTVRDLGAKRIINVFGCGGDRDKKKRPLMGDISARLSDISIVTSDNPRSEEPMDIINAILPAFEKNGVNEMGRVQDAKKGYLYFADRETAIKKAVEMMRKGDAVIVAGKGHEDYQIIKGRKMRFDDTEAVIKCLKLCGVKIIY